MTDAVKKPNRTAIFIISWIGLMIFNLLFARLTTTVPVSIISIFMLFTSVALYKERVTLRPFAFIAGAIAICFLFITYIGTIWMRYEVVNLLDIRGPKFFEIGFYLFSFMNAAAFTTVGLGLFKALNNMKTALITFVLTALIYFIVIYLLRDFLSVLMQISAQIPPG